MEEAFILSGATSSPSAEVSESVSSHQLPILASKFKGVVNQQNGHWGAQIYANHQRIWLGTFRSEKEAASAYDSASMKLRNGDSHRNFPWTEITLQEPNFQIHFTTEAVLDMIKDGSYATKFSDFLRAGARESYNLTHGALLKPLFQKELTPSDVSKLNRLVIPKKYAVKYFPPICNVEEQNGSGEVDDVELVFFDRSMRTWKFRYCYWRSSQSFVFTRGWNRFAQEKGLMPRDRVIFLEYGRGERLWVIDVAYNEDNVDGRSEELGLQLEIGQPRNGVEIMDLGSDSEENANELQLEIGQPRNGVDIVDLGSDLEENANELQLEIGQPRNGVDIVDLGSDSEENANELQLEIGQPRNEVEIMDLGSDSEENANENEVRDNVGGDVPVRKEKGFKLFGVQII